MAIYDNSISAYALNVGEYFMNVEDIEEEPSSIKAYITKIMPDIPLGDSASTSERGTINRSIFSNASDCSVCGLGSLVRMQNYITVYPYSNEVPNFHYKVVQQTDGTYKVPKHSKFLLEVQNNDLLNMHYTGKI